MIFYFTGTGNSGFLAEKLAESLDDKIVSISKLMKSGDNLKFTLEKDEAVGFVFPIYAWGPPKMVEEFVKKAEFENLNNNYTFAVASCGENVGNTMSFMKKILSSKNMNLSSGFSVVMPNNYIIMGDIDSKEIADNKLKEASTKIERIAEVIKNRENGVFEVTKGPFPSLLTGVIHPFFTKGAADTKKFVVSDDCTGCGMCERVCTCGTIKLVDNKPVWGEECNQCLACVHHCKVRAIQYGKNTAKKGRYVNPYFKNYNDR